MLCEKCKNKEATVFYEENINGSKRSYSLCADCAAELQKQGHLSFGHSLAFPSLDDLHNELFGGLFGLGELAPREKKSCPLCRATLTDFRKEGKMGCPECYKTFSAELGDTIRSIHGNVKHAGRAPARFRRGQEKKNRLEALKKQLKDAIASENFEQAVTLRDEIRALEENQ